MLKSPCQRHRTHVPDSSKPSPALVVHAHPAANERLVDTRGEAEAIAPCPPPPSIPTSAQTTNLDSTLLLSGPALCIVFLGPWL